jgi:hypothetical protein
MGMKEDNYLPGKKKICHRMQNYWPDEGQVVFISLKFKRKIIQNIVTKIFF